MKKINPGIQIVETLKALYKSHPHIPIAEHIEIALQDFGSLACVSDKEFSYQLSKYKAQLELDICSQREDDSYLDKIIKDGMNLDNLLVDEED